MSDVFELPAVGPLGWASDSLTLFIDNMRKNQFATFAGKDIVGDLIMTERALRSLLTDAVDPNPWFPFQFMVRGHSVFLAAASAAMAGQNYESTVLQRASLECAAYGLFIGDDEARAQLWLSRHETRQARDNVRSAFSIGKVTRDIEAKDADLARAFSVIYETAIDFGGHPNERGFSKNTTVREDPNSQSNQLFESVYLHGDGPQLKFALEGTVQQGIWNILAFRHLYPEVYNAKDVDRVVRYLKSRH